MHGYIKKEMSEDNMRFINSELSTMKVLTSFSEGYEKTYNSLKK